MQKVKKILFIIILTGCFGSAIAACPEGKSAITKTGYYGVLNAEDYSAMDSAIKSQDDKKLSTLLSDNAAIKVPEGVEVCIKHIAFQWYRTQIAIPGKSGEYWVSDDALNKIK